MKVQAKIYDLKPTNYIEHIIYAQSRLRFYIETENFEGYDPYDVLMGKTDLRRLGNNVQAVIMQLHKRNPVNLRQLLGIPKQRNDKAVGLLLNAYCLLPKPETQTTIQELFSILGENRLSGKQGWGYPFHWANPLKYLPAGTPSAVVTGFVIRGVHAYQQLSGDPRSIDLMLDAAQFVLDELPRTITKQGICFSYTAVKQDCCYNASLLAAEVLARLFSINKDPILRDLVHKAVNYVIAQQHTDGRWNYSYDPATGKERTQIDFHQGFILDSMAACQKYANLDDPAIDQALVRGAEFYFRNQFLPDGRSIWRYPIQWPVDIHNQAQGIITFSHFATLDSSYLNFAHTIAKWTIQNMQDSQGYFYYQKHRIYTNRIPYLRWSQAWMFLALNTLITADRKN